MKTKIKSYEEFVAKIDSLKEKSGVDLSITEDLSLAVMNLISLEEHFFFTGVKTGKENYFDTSLKVRDLRKELLAKLMPNHEGETWCISKHLLATTMRLMEVGNKLRSDDKNSEAVDMFKRAYKVYSIFWALKLKLVSGSEVKEKAKESANLEDLVNKLADCCDE